MKVKLLISRGGAGFTQNAGDEVEVSEDEAKRMIEAGQAVPIAESKTETAVSKKQTQKAVKD